MKYGYFDDVNREYVITTPKTPYPWINYLGNKDFFGIISNTGGGYCFYKDAKLRRITRYRYNNMPIDNNGRYYYINDGGDVWCPGWMPVKNELSFYECRQGLGYTSIAGERNEIKVKSTMFVPLDCNCEIHCLKIKNESGYKKDVKLFSFMEFCLWDALDDMTNFQRNLSTGEVEIEGPVIYHKTEYRERRNHYSFFSVNTSIDGFDTDRESFLGRFNGPESPEAVYNGHCTNSEASGWSPIGSHCINISLEPGAEKEFIFILGYVENPDDEKWESPGVINKSRAKEMIDRFKTSEDVEEALCQLKSYWDELLSHYTLTSGEDKLDRMVNIWNPYQCMVTFNLSRSASYFESGTGRGMGFRDSNQDLLGFVHMIPERARERIIDLASTQFDDGSAYHQYQPLTKRGNNNVGSGFNDDPLWLILAVCAYIKETGDFSILYEAVPFDNNADKCLPLFEHLKASFDHCINNLGPHGLPLIGRADWNDCLNLNCFSKEPGESFQICENKDGKTAESVLIAGMFVYIGNEYARLCETWGKPGEALRARGHVDNIKNTVLKHGYDGEWFLRAYDDFGDKVGSHENSEGRIFIEPQGFCVMAGIGVEEGFAGRALDSVKEHLDTKYGIVLNNPPYTKYYINLGEISSYPPGYKENAGIFCHNNPWIMCAETVLGRGDRAFELYRKICPSYTEDISDIHKMEPYAYAQMVAGKDAQNFGEAKNSWLTGTAAWNYEAISQWILGIEPDYSGLKIDPCIPKEWKGFKIGRKFRKSIYDITVKNEYHVSKGVKEVIVDGVRLTSNIIPPYEDGKTHEVIVIM